MHTSHFLLLAALFATPFFISLTAAFIVAKKGWGSYFSKAGIATTLKPILHGKITPATTIRIVGSRCANLDNPDYTHWTLLLEDLIRQGAKITYLMIDPSNKSEMLLGKFQDRYPGKFETIFLRNPEKIAKPEIRRLALECIETHFILFENPKMIWIEGRHPQDSTFAFDCEFVNEKRAATDHRFRSLSRLFEDFTLEASKLPLQVTSK